MSTDFTAHPETRVGHVHLKVADLDRAIAFYSGLLCGLPHIWQGWSVSQGRGVWRGAAS